MNVIGFRITKKIRGYRPRFPDFGPFIIFIFSCVCVQNVWKMTKNTYFQHKNADYRTIVIKNYQISEYQNAK